MRPFDSIILTQDLAEHGFAAGTEGAIVDTLAVADVFLVELFDRGGDTLDVVEVHASQMTVTLADFVPGEQVALLDDLPTQNVTRGQVGIIQERVGVGLYAVAFVDAQGETFARLHLHARQIMLLHWHPSKQSA